MIVLSEVTQHSTAAVSATCSGNDAPRVHPVIFERVIQEQSKAGRA